MKDFDLEIQDKLIKEIISKFYSVYNQLGYGFLERVYQNALYYSLIDSGIKCELEKSIKVFYNGHIVGDYRADLVVEDCIILELKACDELNPCHEAQLLNYLKASEFEVGYLLNFGKSAVFKRKVFSNSRKELLNKKDLRNL